MPISTLQTTKSRFANLGSYLMAILGGAILVFSVGFFLKTYKTLGAKAGLNVAVLNGDAEVYVNNEKLGTTPFESSQIKPGENIIKIVGANNTYESKINFIKDNEKIPYVDIRRDLGISEFFSSGQNASYDKDNSGNVLSIISDPSGAKVYIDNTEIGITPFTSAKLSKGEYDFRVEYPNYEPQTGRILVTPGMILNVNLKLFPMPVPIRANLFEGSENLYNLSVEDATITSNPQAWVNSVIYWNKTRGIDVAGYGVNKEKVFDFYIDYQGNVYDTEGKIVDLNNPGSTEFKKGAYLGKTTDGANISVNAQQAYQKIQEGGLIAKTAKIKDTPTGWLRVRSEPSLDGAEIARVNSTEEYKVLEEQEGWTKIQINETTQGWVSSDYVEII